MSEYINGINITTHDGNIKQLRFGGNEPVVECLGVESDISERIKEIYIAGSVSPYNNEIIITFMNYNVIQITLPPNGDTKTVSSDNGFYEFNFNNGGILYMYVDTSKTVINGTTYVFRIINLKKHKYRSQSPTISLHLKINDLEEKIKILEESITPTE